jgi:hypothetical protein
MGLFGTSYDIVGMDPYTVNNAVPTPIALKDNSYLEIFSNSTQSTGCFREPAAYEAEDPRSRGLLESSVLEHLVRRRFT